MASENFEKWWREAGQFGRAGGGEYEKTFAFNAWNAALASQPSAPQATPPQPASPDVAKMVEEMRELLSEALSAAESSGHPLNHSRSKDAAAARDELLAMFERIAGPGK